LTRRPHARHVVEARRVGGAAFPYAIHTVPTDDGIAFADAPRYRRAARAFHHDRD
jgi:hypothetical protein